MSRPKIPAIKPAVAWLIEKMPEIVATRYQDKREVGHTGWALLAYLADRSNTGTGTVWMTLDTMTRETSIEKTHRDRLLAAFRSMGWLVEVGRERPEGARGGTGTPVYVLALVPALADLHRATVAASEAITAEARAAGERLTSASRSRHTPTRGDEKSENANVSGANRENVNPYPYPYPDATDAPTGELGQVVPMSQGAGEWGTIHDQVLAGCLAALPMDGAKNPEAWRTHHRKKLRGDIIPTVLGNTRNPGPDQVPDLVVRCLAAAGFSERAPSAPQVAPNGRGGAALTQVAGMARTPTFGDDAIRDYIGDQDSTEHADLVAEVRRHRPTFTLGEEPGERATG